MSKLFKTLLILLIFTPSAYAQRLDGGRIGSHLPPLGFREEATSDIVRPRIVIMDVGTITDNLDGTMNYNPASSDLVEATYVPYTSAIKAVDLGSQDITTTGTGSFQYLALTQPTQVVPDITTINEDVWFQNITTSVAGGDVSFWIGAPIDQGMNMWLVADVGDDGGGDWEPSIGWRCNPLYLRMEAEGPLDIHTSDAIPNTVDYTDYIRLRTVSDVPEITTVGACDLKINAGGSNDLLLNDAGGNVGIGTTTPLANLDVGGGTNNDLDGINDLLVKDATEINGNLFIGGYASADSVRVTTTATADVVQAQTRVDIGPSPVGTIWKDTSNNLVFYDQITGPKTLATLAASGAGAPATVDYLVGTADATLSAEIVVGTTPGGHLGNTWASPTVTDFALTAAADAGGQNIDDIATATSDVVDTQYVEYSTGGAVTVRDDLKINGDILANTNRRIGGLEDIDFNIFAPDSVNDEIYIFHADADKYPNGIKLVNVQITLGADAAYSLVFEEWSGDPPTAENDIHTVATGASDAYAEVTGASITDSDIDADDYIFLHVPSTDVDWVGGKIIFYAK